MITLHCNWAIYSQSKIYINYTLFDTELTPPPPPHLEKSDCHETLDTKKLPYKIILAGMFEIARI